MVCLYWLQDRDSMPNWYTIKHPTTLQTIWNSVTHCCSPMALCTAGFIHQAKLPSPDTSRSPNMTVLSASIVQMLVHCVVKYSRPPDLKPSSNVCLPFAWITGSATDPNTKYANEYQTNLLCLTPSKISAQEDTFPDVEPVRDWKLWEIQVKSELF